MAPLPLSDQPGHRALKERVDYALDRLEELPGVDFKQSASWNDLRGKIVRSILGMGNLRDGGLVIIGVAERDHRWELTGVRKGHGATYNPDTMADFVDRYVSPRADFSVIEHSYQNAKFVVIHVKPFSEAPLVCKRDLPNEQLQAGAVYVRPSEGKPQTTRVQNAEQMHELLELAAERRARRILEQAHRIGLLPSEHEPEETDSDAAEKFTNELEDL